jgi:hypothetical protein
MEHIKFEVPLFFKIYPKHIDVVDLSVEFELLHSQPLMNCSFYFQFCFWNMQIKIASGLFFKISSSTCAWLASVAVMLGRRLRSW